MARDGIEYVLVTCPEDEVSANACCGLRYARGDRLGVPLAAAFRLWAGHVPLPVVQCGRPVRMGIARRVDSEPPGGMQIAGRMGDDGGVVTIRQHDHAGRAAGSERGQLAQVRQRSYPDRGRGGAVRQPTGEQNLSVRRDHHPGTAGDRIPGTGGQRPGGMLVGAQPAGLPDGIGPGHIPGVLLFGWRIRDLDRGRHHEVGCGRAWLKGTQLGTQL